MAQTFRQQAQAEHDRLATRKQELELELAGINEELSGLIRYLNPPTPGRSTPRQPRPQTGDRLARGEVQDKVKDAVLTHPDGITTSQLNKLLEDLHPQSIQNALTALRKANTIRKDRERGGKYRPTTPP